MLRDSPWDDLRNKYLSLNYHVPLNGLTSSPINVRWFMPSRESLVVTLAALHPNTRLLKQMNAMQSQFNWEHNSIINQIFILHECSLLMLLLAVSTPTPSAFQIFCIRLQVFSPNPLQLPADAPFISAQNHHPCLRPSPSGCSWLTCNLTSHILQLFFKTSVRYSVCYHTSYLMLVSVAITSS